MADRTGIDVIFLPEDREYFEEEVCETVRDDEVPSLLVGYVDQATPDELNEWAALWPEMKFIGMHGSSASYSAHKFVAPGNGAVYAHPCDEAGNLSMPNISLDSLGDIPMGFSSWTLEFIITYRSTRAKMLDAAAESAEKRLKEIEEEEAAVKAQKLRGDK